jgi:cell division protein FtsI (penicillin-binding protein 3)
MPGRVPSPGGAKGSTSPRKAPTHSTPSGRARRTTPPRKPAGRGTPSLKGAGTPSRTRAKGNTSRTPAGRLLALLVALTVAFSSVLFRLVLLQVKDASALQRIALDQRIRTIDLPASRGSILDRNGRALAMSVPAKAVFADPALVTDASSEARAVAAALRLRPAAVAIRLTQPGRFVYLARGVDPATAQALQEQHLAGIGFLDESRRYYPDGALAPQVVGFVGVDGTGLAGLELQYQSQLGGRPGHEVVQRDPSGTLIPQAAGVNVPPIHGDDIILTIDRQIQYQAQEALAAAVAANRAKGGTIVVMDPHTGEILAMASYPWFDPNDFSHADQADIRNLAVTDAYEPGSVNKVITAAAAIQEGVLDLKERITVPDSYQLYTKTFHDAEPHPTQQMTLGDIIAYSSNIGTIETANMLGTYRFPAYLHRFGLGARTGVGFPGESPGILPPAAKWSGTSMGTIPIGQGIAVTPLQMATVFATIANGGVWVQPRFLRAVVGSSGQTMPSAPPVTRRVVSASAAESVSRMLGYAVDVGTGQQAQIPGYWVAGKTGTARKVLPDGTGYYTGKYVASFIGFAPASHPALVVAAVLDEPATVFGGIAAAPLFRAVMQFALARLRVPEAPKLSVPPHAIRMP